MSAPDETSSAGYVTAPTAKPRNSLADHATDLALRGLIGSLLLLPYRSRLACAGWLMARLVAPLTGQRRRIRDNLAHVCPELPEAEIRRLLRAVPDNFGRTLIEEYSGEQFIARALGSEIRGPGYEALCAARDAGRPAVLVSGHFGNYDALRAVLIRRGFRFGALYRPFNNARFDRHYRRALERIGTPIFPRNRRGETAMLKFLRAGGMVGLLADQHMDHGAALRFFGKPAATALSAAKMALRHDALLVPFYGIRLPSGIDFELLIEAPIPHTTPEEMSQALNDSLEAQVRKHMGQWMWNHRRWKLAPGGGRPPAPPAPRPASPGKRPDSAA